ncbi:MAG: type II secretion system protein GspG [Planctomycetota bacterium]
MLACLLVRSAVALSAVFVSPMVAHAAASERTGPAPYLQTTENDAGAVTLRVAARTFERADAPLIRLVGAVHIGRPEYYAELQELIEAHDLVLYEAVGGGPQIAEPQTDEERVDVSRSRVRLVAMLAARYALEHGDWPTLDTLAAAGPLAQRSVFARARTDAFGNELRLRVERAFEDGTASSWATVTSLGADGAPGGEGYDADIIVQSRDFSDDEIEPEEGLQKRMATALGLSFQMEEMAFDRPHFRNSDMSISQLTEALERRGEDAEAAGELLLQTLSGQSVSARIAGVMLRFIERSPGAAVVARAVMADLLSQADKLLTTQPGAMGELMAVILDERNAVVVNDLTEILDNEVGIETIAVIYGAGHLDGIEHALVQDLGYTAMGDEWFDAIVADPKAEGVDARFVSSLRSFMNMSIETQLRAAEMQAERDED